MSIRIFQKGFNYSQDGPGNRLVYHLQGCNLRCPWCSNPEGLSPAGGMEYTIAELMNEVKRSSLMFFDGGGVTLTGGEATMQFYDIQEFLSQLHSTGIHTCIETNGTSKLLPKLFPVLDLLIMDIKHYDTETHHAVTSLSNDTTIKNITAALDANQALALRIPLIGGFNASEGDAHGFVKLFSELGIQQNTTIELLPYHEYGKDKYASLNMEYTMTENAHISGTQLHTFTNILESAGFHIIKT
jgi:pyruvate formate lyase activating enzyme